MLPLIFGIPLLQMLILVYAATFDMKKIDMVVVDKDLSATSRELIAKFEAIPFYNVTGTIFDVKLADEMLLKDEADIAMVFPNNMEKNLIRDNDAQIQLLVNAIDGNSAQLSFSYTANIIGEFNKNLIAEWKGIPKFAPPSQVKITESYWYNPELDYKWFMAPGILAILVTIVGMFLAGINLVREKEIGTIEQLNVSPIKKYQFIISKLVPFWLIGLFDLAFGLIIARLFFNLPVVGSIFLLFGFASVYLIGVLGLGLFLSAISETQQQVMFISYFFLIIFILMGGIFTPVESMPNWAQEVNRINPIFYFMRIMRMIVLKGSGFSDLIKEFLSLLSLGILFLSLAIWKYKKTA